MLGIIRTKNCVYHMINEEYFSKFICNVIYISFIEKMIETLFHNKLIEFFKFITCSIVLKYTVYIYNKIPSLYFQ